LATPEVEKKRGSDHITVQDHVHMLERGLNKYSWEIITKWQAFGEIKR
jgi:hypothetical protein